MNYQDLLQRLKEIKDSNELGNPIIMIGIEDYVEDIKEITYDPVNDILVINDGLFEPEE